MRKVTIPAILLLLSLVAVTASSSWAEPAAGPLGIKSVIDTRLQIKSAAFRGYSSHGPVASPAGNGSAHLVSVPLKKDVDAFVDISSAQVDGLTKKNRPLDTRSVVGFHFCID